MLVAHGRRLVLSLNMLPANVAAGSMGLPGDAGNRAIVYWSSLSEDGGQTWTPSAIEPATNLVAADVTTFDNRGRLLLADDRRLWTSTDYGQT